MVVFDLFPNAIEAWKIGAVSYGTITGNKMTGEKTIHVVVDAGNSARTDSSPNAATIAIDTLLYCQPAEMPTTDTSTLVSDYMVRDPQGRFYAIEDAGIGKNQHTGEIEHIELKLRPTGAEPWQEPLAQ